MSVRKDSVQISIEFLTDETKAFARTIEDTKSFQKELQKIQKQGGDVNGAIQKIVDSGKSLASLDLKNVMPAQLGQRAEQLKNALKFIPEMHPARVQMEQELKAINDRMAEMNTKTKGVSESMKNMKPAVGGLQGVFNSAFSIFLGGGLIGAVMAVVGGIFNIGKSAVKAGADMESLTVTLEVLMGSAAQAKKFLKDIQDFAAATPFEFPQLAEAGKKLVAFGYSGDEAMVMLRRLGEVSAAAQVPIEELAGIVGKAKLGQLIQGEELNQLADRGINVFGELATVLGTTESKIKKLGSEGKISYADLEKAIVLATDKGGQFFGLMDKQSKTFTGLMSTLSDNFGQFTQAIFGNVSDSLKPIIAGISGFFGQLTLLIREGKQPVGEYAEVIQYTGNVVSFLGRIFGVVWESAKVLFGLFGEGIKITSFLANRVADATGWFVQMAQKAKDIPIIGTLFRPLLNAIGLVSDLLSNASATFAGFRAAAGQAVTNVQNYFRALVIDAQILGAKIGAALSFDKAAKENAARYIQQLESQKAAIFQGGKTVEQAYLDGRNAAIAVGQQAEAQAEVKRKAKQQAAVESDAKAEKKAADDRAKRLKDALELELKDKDIFYRREELANEISFKQKEKTESDFNRKQIELERDKYTALIKIYDTYQAAFGNKSEQFKDLEIKKLEAQSKLLNANADLGQFAPRNTQVVETLETRQITSPVKQNETTVKLNDLQAFANEENRILAQKFADQLITEIDFENQKAAIRKEYADRALQAAIESGTAEKSQIERLNQEKKAADDNYHKTLQDNEKRTAQIKSELEQTKLGLASKTFSVGIELLSKDEAARKRNAGTIKAFQIGEIVANGVAEVAAIWKNANSNPANILFPGAGTAIAVVQTALAAGRSAAAIARVASQKFARGTLKYFNYAKQGIFGGRDHANGGTKGYFDDGTTVEVERDEAWVVVNKQNTPLLSRLSAVNAYNGNGIPFFNLGGALSFNTTPSYQQVANQSTPSVSVSVSTENLERKLDDFIDAVVNRSNSVRAYVTLDDLEARQESVYQDRSDASF